MISEGITLVKADARRLALSDPVLWIAALVCGALLAGLSIAQYLGYNAGMLDLGKLAPANLSENGGQPLLSALDALDSGAWRRYALFIALALSCKFYVAAPVAGIGAYMLLWGGRRRAGAATIIVAVAYGLLAFLVVRPLFAGPSVGVAAASRGYTSYYFGQIAEIWDTLGDRLLSALVVFGPVLLVAWRGWRWLLPGMPIAIAALLTTGPGGAYDYRYHHYAVVVPFIVMATIAGVEASAKRARASA